MCQGNQAIYTDIDSGNIRKLIGTLLDVFGEKPREIKVIYRNFKYQQVISYEGFNVLIRYIYDYKGVFRIDEVTLYRDIAKAFSIYSRQGRIKQEQYWDSVTFNYKGFTYTLYGPFVEERLISNKSFFLIRQKYVRDKRVAFIFQQKEDEETISVKMIDEHGDQDIKMAIRDNMIDIPQKILPDVNFKLRVLGFIEKESENLTKQELKCILILPDEIREILKQNKFNANLLEIKPTTASEPK